MSSVKKEIEIVMLLAMVKCVSEQCDILRDQHKHQAKQKFNRLIKIAKIYDDEIINNGNHEDDVDVIYDKIMDIIIELKQLIIQEYEKDNSI